MGAISNLFGYLLNLLYELVNNYGIAIILFSVLLRIILLPITIKQQKSMEKTNKIQGELKSLQFKYKNNPEMLNKETMELYKREKISPFSGCLSAILQIIIILSVFWLVSQPLTYMKKVKNNDELNNIVESYKTQIQEENSTRRNYIEIEVISRIEKDYETIKEQLLQEDIENKEELEVEKNNYEKLRINMEFLGLDLSKVPRNNLKDYKVYIIPLLYVISSFVSIRISTNMQNKKKETEKENNKQKDDSVDASEAMAQMNKNMSYIMPLMTLSIAFIAPLGLALYWFVSNVLMIVERLVIKKVMSAKEV